MELAHPENDEPDASGVRILRINGEIAADSWMDDVSPQIFVTELNSGSGYVLFWLHIPRGDVMVAVQIYNLVAAYPDVVTPSMA